MSARKLQGFEFWEKALRKAKYVVAPMVEHSELPWRILSRRYGAELCYTPMLNARCFVEEKAYSTRPENLTTNAEDRPLIVQFCANDPGYLLQAAKLVENMCDAVDINFGCPQNIARRGHYGSYLQDEWDLVESLVRVLHENLAVPVTCKIRIFPDVEKSIRYAKMLENAGCQLLTVHGRLREQKGADTGLADWEQIRRIKAELKIPVFANGNVLYHEDIQRCLEYTKADGVMTAEGNLYNPAIFTPQVKPIWEAVDEYLEICRSVEHADSCIRGHLFKMYRPCIMKYTDLRDRLGKIHTLEDFVAISKEFNDRLKEDAANCGDWGLADVPIVNGIKKLPHWVLQPCIREVEDCAEKKSEDVAAKRQAVQEQRAQGKQRQRPPKIKHVPCGFCNGNVASLNCPWSRCKKCCVSTREEDPGECSQHRPQRNKEKRPKLDGIMVAPSE